MSAGSEVDPTVTVLPMDFAGTRTSGCGAVPFRTRDPVGRPLGWGRSAIPVAALAAFVIGSMKIMLLAEHP
ncbi:MAG: hypothetical protein A2W29_01515 [Gemmatimonadetes bacterium RBG_16_66_8]|nr:MAG: hypothetical protein A2W29_01515 [Gemmatimonadetes bacterium RBG_16_66_8]